MKADFSIENPDAVPMTMTITMTLAEWKELRKLLIKDWSHSVLSHVIADLTRKAEAKFHPDPLPK